MDLLVVILGITIAFGIDSWAEGRKNERVEQKYLRNLQVDLKKDSARLVHLSDNIDTMQYSLRAVMKLYGNVNKSDSIGYYLTTLGNDIRFSPENYTYEALQQSGDFRLVRSDSLRLELSRLYDDYKRYDEQEEVANQMFMRYIVDFLENYNPSLQSVTNPEMYNNQRFIFGINVYYSNLRNRERIIKGAAKSIDKVQRLIDESLS